jgi:hypothetical protein
MNNFKNIQSKLEAFIKRFYTNELLKGAILFFAIGLLYFLFTLFIEYVLWLNTTARSILFWFFVAVEFGLLVKFILFPLAKLLKLQKGINYKEASKLIGKHFPEVNDKLLNVLQLNESDSKSELLLASIDQKALELKPVPFKLAVNFKKNLGYLKYAAIPVLILLLTFFTGHFNWFSDSYTRVVNYKTAYEPPAPFQFFVVNENLNAIENKDFKLVVKTAGDVIPESAQITYNNETYFLQQKGIGEFEYVFSQPKEAINFQLLANDVISKPYTINVVEVPSLLSFEMELDYPSHTKKKNEVLKSTGNAVVPEGTEINWKLKTKSTTSVNLFSKDTIRLQKSASGIFGLKREIFKNFTYTLSTSNTDLKNYENVSFNINVVKDEYPELKLKVKTDSLDLESLYFYGQVSDDYGFSKLQLVYYPTDDESDKKVENISISKSNISEFISAFPNTLKVEEGISYSLYFEVFDNDLINKFKSTKSNIFFYRKRTVAEEEKKQLKEQKDNIEDLNKSLENLDEQDKKLDGVRKTQKEKSNLSFNDKKKLESFLKRQKEQDEMMKNFNQKLKNNLDEYHKENPRKDDFKEDLKKRLNENEEKLKRDEKLLEQIKNLQKKIRKDELVQKLDELAKENKNKKKSLQQLLELTKRFYVEKKIEKLKEDLMKLAIEQEKLSNQSDEENTKKKQELLNKEFDDFKNEIEELQEENKSLKKPMEIPRDKIDEKEVDKEQDKATEALEKKESESAGEKPSDQPNVSPKDNSQDAKESQKNAAKKMMKMSQQMGAAMASMEGDQMQEDVDMLRQVLDNLVVFSFDQEALMENFKAIEVNHNKFAVYLKKQNDLKENFEHVDDSLFALSLRQPKLSEQVNNEITEVYYSMDRALEMLAENSLYQGISSQQFAVTSANNLADFLSDVLDNLQENMSMSMGKGQGGDMQLPDIIMSQEQLNQMMDEGMKKGEQGMAKQGEGDKDGNGEKKGEGKKDGKSGKEGDNGGEGKDGGKSGEGLGGLDEDSNGELFKIYQQQQQLREALEEQLNKNGNSGNTANGNALLRQMEQIELDLLNKGFDNGTLQKMMQLKHQLLKLDKASFQQGEESKRKSETNKNDFNNRSMNQIPTAKQYFNTTEILNRQSLPLQQIYKKKVQEYFKQSND